MPEKKAGSEWYRLDNAGVLYSALQKETYSAIYRFSAVMDQPVDRQALQRAVDKTMPRFPTFRVRIKKGAFWYYFEPNDAPGPFVKTDISNPCQPVRFREDNGWLVRFYYYERRISVEVFHAVSDGGGALVFFKTLLTVYLREMGYTVSNTCGILDVDAPPRLEELEMKAVISIIVGETDKYTESGEVSENYTHMTWDEINEMMESGLVEFQNHSYNLHALTDGRTGSARCEGEGDDAYCALLSSDLTAMQEKLREELGEPASCFVYPFGAVGSGEEEIVQGLGFRCTLTCEDRINWITRKGGFLSLGRRLRPPDCSSEAFFADLLGS